MKFNNVDLAIELARCAKAIGEACAVAPEAVRALAQYIADRPTMTTAHQTALQLLNINNIPSETWGQPWPDRATGEQRVAESVARLNDEYAVGSLYAIVALRRLAWDCQQLARELQRERTEATTALLATNEGRTAGLFSPGPDQLTPEARENFRYLLGGKPGVNNG